MHSESQRRRRLYLNDFRSQSLFGEPCRAEHETIHPTLIRGSSCQCPRCNLLRSVRRGVRALESEKKRKKALLKSAISAPLLFLQTLVAESLMANLSLLCVSVCVVLPVTAAFSLGRDEPTPVIQESGYVTQQMILSATGSEQPTPQSPRRPPPPTGIRITPG
jgi:hypothetical protein